MKRTYPKFNTRSQSGTALLLVIFFAMAIGLVAHAFNSTMQDETRSAKRREYVSQIKSLARTIKDRTDCVKTRAKFPADCSTSPSPVITLYEHSEPSIETPFNPSKNGWEVVARCHGADAATSYITVSAARPIATEEVAGSGCFFNTDPLTKKCMDHSAKLTSADPLSGNVIDTDDKFCLPGSYTTGPAKLVLSPIGAAEVDGQASGEPCDSGDLQRGSNECPVGTRVISGTVYCKGLASGASGNQNIGASWPSSNRKWEAICCKSQSVYVDVVCVPE